MIQSCHLSVCCRTKKTFCHCNAFYFFGAFPLLLLLGLSSSKHFWRSITKAGWAPSVCAPLLILHALLQQNTVFYNIFKSAVTWEPTFSERRNSQELWTCLLLSVCSAPCCYFASVWLGSSLPLPIGGFMALPIHFAISVWHEGSICSSVAVF